VETVLGEKSVHEGVAHEVVFLEALFAGFGLAVLAVEYVGFFVEVAGLGAPKALEPPRGNGNLLDVVGLESADRLVVIEPMVGESEEILFILLVGEDEILGRATMLESVA